MIRFSDKALISKYLDGKRVSEIAKELNVKTKQVEARLHYLRRNGVKIPRRVMKFGGKEIQELNAFIESRQK